MITIFQKLVLMSYTFSTLSVLKLLDVYNYYLLKFVRCAMSDRPSYLKYFMNHIYLDKIFIQ